MRIHLTTLCAIFAVAQCGAMEPIPRWNGSQPRGDHIDEVHTRFKSAVRLRDYASAVRLGEYLLGFAKQHCGDRPVLRGRCFCIAAQGYERQRDRERSQILFRQAISLLEAHRDVAPAELARCLTAYANLVRQMRRLEEAETLLKRAMKLHSDNGPPDDASLADTMLVLADTCKMARQFASAGPLYERGVALRIKAHGENHQDTGNALRRFAYFLNQRGDHPHALESVTRAHEILRSTAGPAHPDTLRAAAFRAVQLNRLGRRSEALAIHEQLVPAFENSERRDDRAYAEVLKNFGWALIQDRRAAEARPLFERAVEIRRRVDGPESLELAGALLGLARCRSQGADPALAESLFERVIDIRRQKLGPVHRETRLAMEAYAHHVARTGSGERAIKLFEELVALQSTAWGPDDPRTFPIRFSLAAACRGVGRFEEADALLRRLSAAQRQREGPAASAVLETDKARINVLRLAGKLTEALELARSVHKRRSDRLGSDHPLVIADLLGLAHRLHDIGDFEKAQSTFVDVVERTERTHGERHEKTGEVLRALAVNCRALSRFAEAEAALKRSLAIAHTVWGEGHVKTAAVLRELGEVLHEMSQVDRAERVMRRVLGIRRAKLGLEHEATANAEKYLAHILYSAGRYAEAEEHARQARVFYDRRYGTNHHLTISPERMLGLILHAQGRNAQAEPLLKSSLERQLATYGERHRDTGYALRCLGSLYADMGRLKEAEALFRRAIEIAEHEAGPGQNNAARRARHHLSLLLYRMGRDDEALRHELMAVEHIRERFVKMFSFMSERERLTFRRTMRPWDLLASIGDAPSLARTVIHFKGAVLDSLLEEHAAAANSDDPMLQEAFDRLIEARRKLAASALKPGVSTGVGVVGETESLAAEVARLETHLARTYAARGGGRTALDTDLARLVEALPNRAALLEFVRYFHHHRKGGGAYRYGVVVIRRHRPVSWHCLGPAEDVDANIDELHRRVRDARSDRPLETLLRRLHDTVWKPVLDGGLQGVERVVVCPDGGLNLLPFSCLLDERGRFIGEQTLLAYVASGRDLLLGRGAKTTGEVAIFADPDYSKIGEVAPRGGQVASVVNVSGIRAMQAFNFGALPGAAREGRLLARLHRGRGEAVAFFAGAEATEPRLRSLRSPRILHFAVHGFFLSDRNASSGSPDEPRRGVGGLATSSAIVPRQLVSANPMHRGGFFLAGARQTVTGLANGVHPLNPAADGLVTAGDVATLDLRSTWLVVLSACDTGLGEIQSGEGVVGLRRGFHRAGARNILMALWPVADEGTAAFMVDFHRRLAVDGFPGDAFARAQGKWLQELRRRDGHVAAVKRVGGFVLSTKGRVE